jgi:hypothetical protein
LGYRDRGLAENELGLAISFMVKPCVFRIWAILYRITTIGRWPIAGSFKILPSSCFPNDINRAVAIMLLLFLFQHDWNEGLASTMQSSPETLQEGQRLYEGKARCQGCHGRMALRRPLSKDALFSVIKFGVPGTAHFPFQYLLSDAEIWAIVHFQLQKISSEGEAQGR